MVYIMEIYTDGGCRGNGRPDAIGAAAAVVKKKYGKPKNWYAPLRASSPAPTNQRAEIAGIILALKGALQIYNELKSSPTLLLTIHTDSKYALGCMTDWIYKWRENGWTNAAGDEVANRDLIEYASRLEDKVAGLGRVRYVWIPREENGEADLLCNQCMDRQELHRLEMKVEEDRKRTKAEEERKRIKAEEEKERIEAEEAREEQFRYWCMMKEAEDYFDNVVISECRKMMREEDD